MSRFKPKREWYIDPKHKILLQGGPNGAIVYGDDKYALGFQGKRQKPDWNLRFRSVDERNGFISKWVDGITSHADYMKRRRASRNLPAPQTLTEGTVLYSTWGYEQTNCDFYRIIKRTKDYAWLIRMGSKHVDEYHVVPAISEQTSKQALKKKIIKDAGKEIAVRIESFSHARPWYGEPIYETPYWQGH